MSVTNWIIYRDIWSYKRLFIKLRTSIYKKKAKSKTGLTTQNIHHFQFFYLRSLNVVWLWNQTRVQLPKVISTRLKERVSSIWAPVFFFFFKLVLESYWGSRKTELKLNTFRPRCTLLLTNGYVVVNFLSQVIFVFLLFLGMVMYANEMETKEK